VRITIGDARTGKAFFFFKHSFVTVFFQKVPRLLPFFRQIGLMAEVNPFLKNLLIDLFGFRGGMVGDFQAVGRAEKGEGIGIL